MPTYTVKIEQLVTHHVEVEASDQEEAEALALVKLTDQVDASGCVPDHVDTAYVAVVRRHDPPDVPDAWEDPAHHVYCEECGGEHPE